MKHFFIIVLFILSANANAACSNDLQRHGERCVTQIMADYISCIESNGGNMQDITEEIDNSQHEVLSGNGNGNIRIKKAPINIGANIGANEKIDKIFIKRVTKKWGADGSLGCLKIVNNKNYPHQTNYPHQSHQTQTSIAKKNEIINNNVVISIPPIIPKEKPWQECQRIYNSAYKYIGSKINESFAVMREAKTERERCFSDNKRPTCSECFAEAKGETKGKKILISESDCETVCLDH